MDEPALALVSSHEATPTMRVGARVQLGDGGVGTLREFDTATGQWSVCCGNELAMLNESSLALVESGLMDVRLSLARSVLSGNLSVQPHEKTDVLFEAALQLASTQTRTKARVRLSCGETVLQRGQPVAELQELRHGDTGELLVCVEFGTPAAGDAGPCDGVEGEASAEGREATGPEVAPWYASALAAKERGTAAFRKGKWKSAANEYGAALELYGVRALSSEQRAEQVILHSNRAEAFLKLDEYQAARECATAALEIDPAHAKSLYRRARALRQLGPWIGGVAALAGAEADLRELTRLGGGGAAAAELLREVHKIQAVMQAAREGPEAQGQNSAVPQLLAREREARLAGPTPYQGLRRSGEEQD